MPELPEVETTVRGIKPHLIHQKVVDVIIRHPQLRWPIPKKLRELLKNQELIDITRRGKYILFQFKKGTVILHLGMSGKLILLSQPTDAKKHDHVDICFANQTCLRFNDPRRFGALLFTDENPHHHPLLKTIGVEPLTAQFNSDYLFKRAASKKVCVKSFIMDAKIVAGVGNIYAAEALFAAQIHPNTPAGKLTRNDFKRLVIAIKAVLKRAIKKGGTTLRDFMKSDGSPGYFSIELKAYGRQGEPCLRCQTTLKLLRLGQRSTVYCPHCQK